MRRNLASSFITHLPYTRHNGRKRKPVSDVSIIATETYKSLNENGIKSEDRKPNKMQQLDVNY
jgi:hypothetical protein